MIEVKKEQMSQIASLFEGFEDSSITTAAFSLIQSAEHKYPSQPLSSHCNETISFFSANTFSGSKKIIFILCIW